MGIECCIYCITCAYFILCFLWFSFPTEYYMYCSTQTKSYTSVLRDRR
jgi:hypothetical protein